MIKDSDNNALSILSSNLLIDVDALKAVYQDLEVPFLADPANQQNPEKFDFMTTNNFSYFFRALYNGTYLDREYSEKALQILSDVDFKDGLVAGIPNGISISHKFGLESVAPNGFVITSRELHDCGIIYYPQTPYLLCVMTKSDSSIPSMETAIKNISSFVYKKVDNQYK